MLPRLGVNLEPSPAHQGSGIAVFRLGYVRHHLLDDVIYRHAAQSTLLNIGILHRHRPGSRTTTHTHTKKKQIGKIRLLRRISDGSFKYLSSSKYRFRSEIEDESQHKPQQIDTETEDSQKKKEKEKEKEEEEEAEIRKAGESEERVEEAVGRDPEKTRKKDESEERWTRVGRRKRIGKEEKVGEESNIVWLIILDQVGREREYLISYSQVRRWRCDPLLCFLFLHFFAQYKQNIKPGLIIPMDN